MPDKPLVGIYILPIAKIFEKPAGIIRPAGDFCPMAGITEILFDTGFEQRNLLLVEKPTNDDNTVALECI
jgi:hypothetical protein